MKKLKENCKYALLVPTSMGVRITPQSGQPVAASNMFFMQATSAETNVASISSYLGLPVKVLTTFVEGSPIARFIKSDLRARNMDFEGKDVPQGITVLLAQQGDTAWDLAKRFRVPMGELESMNPGLGAGVNARGRGAQVMIFRR